MSVSTFPLAVGLTALKEYVSHCDLRLCSLPDTFNIGDYFVCAREYPSMPFPPECSRYHFDFGRVFSDFDSAHDFVNFYVLRFEVEDWGIEDYNIEIWRIVSDVDAVLYTPAIFGPNSPVYNVVCNFNPRSGSDDSHKVYSFPSFDAAYCFAIFLYDMGRRHYVIDRHDYYNGRLFKVETLGFCGGRSLCTLRVD